MADGSGFHFTKGNTAPQLMRANLALHIQRYNYFEVMIITDGTVRDVVRLMPGLDWRLHLYTEVKRVLNYYTQVHCCYGEIVLKLFKDLLKRYIVNLI